MECILCKNNINPHEPTIKYKNNLICYGCYIDLIEEIYNMAGKGDGGLIHLTFKTLLTTSHNRSKRVRIAKYKDVLKELKHKYNFSCVHCGTKNNLTIDHIKPVSKGGRNNIENLQLLCKSCNSKKRNKYE